MQHTGKTHREFNVRLNNNRKDINHLIPISPCKVSSISIESMNLENIIYELQINALDWKSFLIKKRQTFIPSALNQKSNFPDN